MANKAGHAEAYKDVIHEDAIKIGGNTKAPDYCFRIGGARKFFLEAKKPAVNLKDEISPAYQLRRYAWSAKLSLSILTDFEEFAVYDCRTRPSPSDKSSTGRILYLTYRDYLTKWEEIACIFAKEAILKGSFDKYALSDRKRGTATVDAEFLKEIESWRESLAKNLATRNPRLSVHELNFGVQRTIDRLIFLRICEDRGIEPSEQLKLILKGKNVYSQLQGIYEKADERYNSGLFHFHPEKDRTESPDDLTPQLKIDDKVLKDIVSRLYYPQSPYEFSVFPPEILGQVYEQFLGKVIRLTSGHQAKVEEKPEIKKAGGIYYTPTYIVEYIGKKTVGLMCEGKTPGQIAQLHILDPACGSGSFLLGAYTYLLDWHLKWYIEHGPEKHGKELFRTMAGNWRLKTVEKRRILLNNVYGVDIDSQAVEVTKLSLLLKVLEGENKESLQELLFGRMRALPDLGQNIKCGNSIVSSEHFADQILPDEDEVRRVNAFDWRTEFPNIFKSGGFDAVIGNPPYVRVGNIDELILSYLYEHYDVAHRFDIYVVFIFKAFDLLSPRGRLGFILPNKFFTADYGKSLRSFLSSRKAVEAVVDFGDSQVFEGASTYTCLLFLNREPQKVFSYLKGDSELLAKQKMSNSSALVDQTQLGEGPWSFLDPTSLQLLTKFANFPRLQDVCQIERGLETGCDEVFFLRVCGHKEEKNKLLVTSKVCPEPFKIERGAVRLLVKGSADVQRYFIESDRALVFPYRHKNGNPELIEARKFEEEFPLAWSYLNDNAQRLKQRGRKEWYSFRRRNYDLRDGVGRVFVPSIGKRLSAAIDPEGVYHFVGSGGGGGGSYALLPNNESNHSIYYILGQINSRLADWFAKLTNSRFGGGYYAFNRQYIEPIPFRQINFASSTEKTFHDRLVIFAQRMVDLHKRLSQATTPNDEEQTRRQIDITDKEIDALVYELYGLTEEEVKVVEAGSAVPLSQSEMKQDVVESELTE